MPHHLERDVRCSVAKRSTVPSKFADTSPVRFDSAVDIHQQAPASFADTTSRRAALRSDAVIMELTFPEQTRFVHAVRWEDQTGAQVRGTVSDVREPRGGPGAADV